MTTTVSTSRFIGGILLIAGCCIGAGMLGLPVLSAQAGFQPSILTFFVCWLFMVSTGLLLLEVTSWFPDEINIVTMAERTLGLFGRAVSWFVFLFLFYSLMVAYMAASGSLISSFVEILSSYTLPHWIGSLFFTIIFGALLYQGTHAVDRFNRVLMVGLIAAYLTLIIVGASYVNPELLAHKDWSATTLVIPAVIVSFGYHNLIPSLNTYFSGNIPLLKRAIWIGSAIPLLIYLVWEWLILGLVPAAAFKEALNQGEIATQVLKNTVNASWIVDVAETFAFFAIVTSFLSVALSFVDFLSDGLNIKKTSKGKIFLCSLVLIPPFFCALIYPTIFLIALNYAGGFGAVILFGILPAVMAWKGRYQQHMKHVQIVPGGKFSLIVIIAFALWVITLQLV